MQFSTPLLLGTLLPGITANPGHHEPLSFHELTRRSKFPKRGEPQAAVMNAKCWAFETLLQELNITAPSTADLHTGNTTFLRGMWPTNANGMLEMKTVSRDFMLSERNGTVVNGNTISTGQIFFDETLSEQIMALEPYVSHAQINRTINAVDSIYAAEAMDEFNPIMSVIPLDGEDVAKGMVAYITLGAAA
ncbi:hypothetical protein G7Y89_g543 [Cudoniella acicularis]|uniref:Uncharacterized protein n=1 Tax=Cudoniella acicularis TaxID=354080 RepID=A0A8H4RY13_9HELO|nr:hypothetical protein G7Y89_g543 [Cudoniella acicularis]